MNHTNFRLCREGLKLYLAWADALDAGQPKLARILYRDYINHRAACQECTPPSAVLLNASLHQDAKKGL